MHLPAYILSGGQSRRFGSDKARYATPAGPQLLVLADQLRNCGHTVHVVADRADRYADLGLKCLVDTQPDSGPLAGLASALAHHRDSLPVAAPRAHGWILLVNCDQRHWQQVWTDVLSKHAHDDVDASIYFDTQWQPLPGLYHIALLPTIIDRLSSRQLSLHSFLDSLGPRCARIHTTTPPCQWSFNTPAELERNDGRTNKEPLDS